jgi:hypothetical protein
MSMASLTHLPFLFLSFDTSFHFAIFGHLGSFEGVIRVSQWQWKRSVEHPFLQGTQRVSWNWVGVGQQIRTRERQNSLWGLVDLGSKYKTWQKLEKGQEKTYDVGGPF